MKTFLENFLAACLLLVILVKLARTQPQDLTDDTCGH